MKLQPFWKPDEATKAIIVTRTDKVFLRGVHRGEPIWKVTRGESILYIRQEEAKEWNSLIEKNPDLAEDQPEKVSA